MSTVALPDASAPLAHGRYARLIASSPNSTVGVRPSVRRYPDCWQRPCELIYEDIQRTDCLTRSPPCASCIWPLFGPLASTRWLSLSRSVNRLLHGYKRFRQKNSRQRSGPKNNHLRNGLLPARHWRQHRPNFSL